MRKSLLKLVATLDFVSPVFDLTIRFWVAYDFFRSGLVKIQSWDSTLALFAYEYTVPLLPPEPAAWLATAAELILPPLLALGLGSRLCAALLFVFNAVAAMSYPEISAAGLKDHLVWGVMLATIFFHGPGRFAIDRLVYLRWMG